ncbi:MAG: phosphotransferase family protein [Polyangiales bacterium]
MDPLKDLLPNPLSDEAFAKIDAETDYGPALHLVAERAGIHAAATPKRFADGSLPVFALGEYVVKLYPPSCAEEHHNERAVLEAVEGALSIGTPEVKAAGALDAWHYLVMTRLRGRPMRSCFDELSAADRTRLSTRLGEAILQLRAVDTPRFLHEDWFTLLARRRAGCVEHHSKRGLAPVWLNRIAPFLDETLPSLMTAPPHSLLHTEVMREHVFVDLVAGRFALSGLVDFDPSRVGPPELELASAGLFFAEGDAAMWSAFLDGLGVPANERGLALARRCMAWALLHKYANLHAWLERLPPRSARRSFDELALEWFGA